MGHRQMIFPPQTSDMDCADIWNHPYPDPHVQQGTTAIGVHTVPYFDITLRSNNHSSTNFSFEIPNHNMGANLGALHNPFPHPSSASSSNPIPSNYIQGGPSCYNEFSINSQMDFERAHFKRKNPAISMAYGRGNNYNYHCAVNSQGNPTSGPQYWAWDPNSMPPSYGNDNRLTVEGSHRNVRSRQSAALHFGINQAVPYQQSNLPHNLHPASNFSGQWGHPPPLAYNGNIPPSGAGNFNSSNTSMEIDGGYHHNLLHSRISTPPLPNLNGPYFGHSSYDQRPHPTTSTHQSVGFTAPLADGRRPGIEAVPPPRQLRPVSITGRSSERNGRSRGLYDRFQQFSYGNNSHSGWISEGRAIYDSRNLFDQHRDMRLDIDNMSYEELLALEERIGNVNTGLSGDTIPKCLVETAHCSSNQIQYEKEEKNCIICLEVYKYSENIGKLACGHDFHSNCIKTWLSIKNACPICKASALPDNSEEK
ncbi:uncharacterized protein A4U43_C02F2480 [Asparagus officinalis]|uniref:RING-type E3 ubiquitin transferase n=1 Tax=Asparagus officinalis TaxID=4686 RepID=A0A5P1FKD5_ASPOF|nr:probable E3 ubiquitin-protein ligase HIP1 [Asparagus officinalis]XP_020252671.1 probable E3 ubiquitin-protein ligase HIP1 [Asparagus officinalis]XP_020252672.1 probable E3 ubiquitin-protein ligase HIP1 [Asparagus officinalis]ONK77040.1 uncharacterized protein A4U43_C02F2480 [Asparagus officinalis]